MKLIKSQLKKIIREEILNERLYKSVSITASKWFNPYMNIEFGKTSWDDKLHIKGGWSSAANEFAIKPKSNDITEVDIQRAFKKAATAWESTIEKELGKFEKK